jgi:hypothetical protein
MTMPKIELAPVPPGLKVRIYHMGPQEVRYVTAGLRIKPGKQPKYYTVAELVNPVTHTVYATGDALCSYKDNPSRKMGRAIAHNRAIKAYTKGIEYVNIAE